LRARAILAVLLGRAPHRSPVAALTEGRCSADSRRPEATVAARRGNTTERSVLVTGGLASAIPDRASLRALLVLGAAGVAGGAGPRECGSPAHGESIDLLSAARRGRPRLRPADSIARR